MFALNSRPAQQRTGLSNNHRQPLKSTWRAGTIAFAILLCYLGGLCVFAVKMLSKQAHRRDAEPAELAQ